MDHIAPSSFNTLGIATATTPTVVGQFLSHIVKARGHRNRGNPQQQLSYDEGLAIVRRFLDYARNHTLEEIQAYTGADLYVPAPRWIKKQVVPIAQSSIEAAETLLTKHLEGYGPDGLDEIGGRQWWKQRGRRLEGEWIEMKKDYLKRAAAKVDAAKQANGHLPKVDERVVLYIHGGAGFFSSLDTHRYQIQRHARKLGGRAFAPAYRLSPQYPFPCGLLDSLAAYLFLIDPPDGALHEAVAPRDLVLSGDSHGAGMILALLCILRDEGIPLPAGAVLISPWLDLCHSFPSIVGDASGDYIPNLGFHFQPSLAWPPTKGDGVEIDIDGGKVLLDDQIQMYCSNRLLSHPLVSVVNQGSLGGLCPLLVVRHYEQYGVFILIGAQIGGSGELLRDEIVYAAHKAASPAQYPPSPAILARYPKQKELLSKYPPTKVHLQMYDGCAHVTPTLAWTSPAKYMYRACANFSIWAINAARKANERQARKKRKSAPSSTETLVDTSGQPMIDSKAAEEANEQEVDEDDVESEESTDEDADQSAPASEIVSVTGTEPSFGPSNIIRERVTTKGRIRAMEPVESMPCLSMSPEQIGVITSRGPIRTWLKTREAGDKRFHKKLAHFRQLKEEDRAKAEKAHFPLSGSDTDVPPRTAVAAWYDAGYARLAGKSVDGRASKTESSLVAAWMRMGSSADEDRKNEAEVEEATEKLKRQGIDAEDVADASVADVKEQLS